MICWFSGFIKKYLQTIWHFCHQNTEATFPFHEPGWGFVTASMNIKWQKWHGMTSTANLKRDMQLMLVSLRPLTPGALSQHVKYLVTLRLPCGKTKWKDITETERLREPQLFQPPAVWVSPTQEPGMWEKEPPRLFQPQSLSDYVGLRNSE